MITNLYNESDHTKTTLSALVGFGDFEGLLLLESVDLQAQMNMLEEIRRRRENERGSLDTPAQSQNLDTSSSFQIILISTGIGFFLIIWFT